MAQPCSLDRFVVVLGAGVAGLTTAVRLQERDDYNVTIIAETLPNDPKKADYTSPWAGAHQALHVGQNERDRQLEQDTFKVMWDLSAPGGSAEHCLRRVTEHEYYRDRIYLQSWMPDFRPIPQNALVPDAGCGYVYSTYTVDPPLYLNYLVSRFLARGGAIVRGRVHHISQILEGGVDLFTHGRPSSTPIDALVLCPGLSARALGGVEDQAMYPSRGEVVLLRAPWISTAARVSATTGGDQTYVIPRMNGVVALGSTKSPNDWYPIARPETTDDILRRCLTLCPELAPPEIRAHRAGTIEDLRQQVLEVGCAFRPARTGGLRLESELVDVKDGRKIPVIYDYGHAGVGYVTSWACASAVVGMLEEHLRNN